MQNISTENDTAIAPSTCYAQILDGAIYLDVTTHNNFWKNETEYILDKSRLVIDSKELKSIGLGDKPFNRYMHDRNVSNPFDRLGGYALNKIKLSDVVFIEQFNLFIRKDFLFLVKHITETDLLNRILIYKNNGGMTMSCSGRKRSLEICA